jgi:HK97 family phage portal protein
MKLFDIIKEKIAKIPLVSTATTRFTSYFRPSSYRNNHYYTSWVYLAVSTIAQEVAGIQLKLFKEDSKGNVEQVFKHPSLDLLTHANDFMTQYDLFERLQSNQELQGNEYWFLTYQGQEPNNIFPLLPGSVVPVQGKFEYVKAYHYFVDGQKHLIPPQNIIQFKQFNPFSDVVGLSTLSAALVSADTDNYAREYNKKYFENDGRPDVILKTPETLSPEDQKKLVNSWHQNHGGPSRQFRTAVASGDLSIEAFQITQRDMEYLEGRKFNRDEIMAIFRVPLAVAGFTGNETYASAKAAAYSFGARTITPKMTRIINTLNEFYLPLFKDTQGMYFEFVSPILEDRDLIIKGYESGLKNGWLSINDVRRMEDLAPIDGGEPVMIPFNVTPLGEPIEGKQPTREPVAKIAKMIAESVFKNMPKKKEEEADKPKELTAEEKEFERKGEFRCKQRNNRGLAYEKQFAAALEELWTGQAQRAINNLKSALARKNWKATAPNVLDKEKEVSATIDLFTPLMTEVTEVEGAAALEYLGLLADEAFVLTPELRKFVEGNTKKFAGEITDVTSKKLRATIAAGLEKGESITDLEKRILDSVSFSPARAENIARTETIRAQGKAELQVWKDSGVVVGKVWYTALDERVCPYCEPMHGKTITLKDAFFSKGEEQIGNDGTKLSLDYEAVEAPPLHPSCRCVLIPEIQN